MTATPSAEWSMPAKGGGGMVNGAKCVGGGAVKPSVGFHSNWFFSGCHCVAYTGMLLPSIELTNVFPALAAMNDGSSRNGGCSARGGGYLSLLVLSTLNSEDRRASDAKASGDTPK